MDRVTLSVNQACVVAGVSRRTIYNWLDAGKIEWIRTAGGGRRIFKDSLFRDANGERLTEATTMAQAEAASV